MTAIRVQLLNYRPPIHRQPKKTIPRWVEICVILVGLLILFYSLLVLFFQLLEIPTSIFSVWYLLPLQFFIWPSQLFILLFSLFLSFPLPSSFFVFFSLISANCASVSLTCLALLQHPLLPMVAALMVISIFQTLVVFLIHRLPDDKKRILFDAFRPRPGSLQENV